MTVFSISGYNLLLVILFLNVESCITVKTFMKSLFVFVTSDSGGQIFGCLWSLQARQVPWNNLPGHLCLWHRWLLRCPETYHRHRRPRLGTVGTRGGEVRAWHCHWRPGETTSHWWVNHCSSPWLASLVECLSSWGFCEVVLILWHVLNVSFCTGRLCLILILFDFPVSPSHASGTICMMSK